MRYPFLRVFTRLLTLLVMALTLIMVSRGNRDQLKAFTIRENAALSIPQKPVIAVDIQPDAPIVISSPRVVYADSQYAEFVYDLTNTSTKAVRAYAIRQQVYPQKGAASSFLFENLPLSGHPPFGPKALTTSSDTSDIEPGKEQRVVLSVDYVEFVDGTTWGQDLGNFAETSAGQRAAAALITARLQQVNQSSGRQDVLKLIEDARADSKPSTTQSANWQRGFTSAVASVTERLKRAYTKGGSNQLKYELSQVTTQLKANPHAN